MQVTDENPPWSVYQNYFRHALVVWASSWVGIRPWSRLFGNNGTTLVILDWIVLSKVAALVFPQVGAAEGVEYTSRSFTYHHASLAQVDDHHVGVPDDDLQVVEAAVMSAKASPVMEEVGEKSF